jgi:hypothetical protein
MSLNGFRGENVTAAFAEQIPQIGGSIVLG